jgi:F-type H+-transporting ATPase subunit delta
MKKIKAKIYAQVLYQLSQETDDLDNVLANFVKLLVSRNQLSLINEIINDFKQIYNKNKNQVDAQVVTPFALDKNTKQLIEDLIRQMNTVQKVELTEIIDKELIGGLVVNFDDTRIDTSIKKQLSLLKNNIK